MLYKIAARHTEFEKRALLGTLASWGRGLINATTKGVSRLGGDTLNVAKNGVGNNGIKNTLKTTTKGIGSDIKTGFNQRDKINPINWKNLGTGAAVIGGTGLGLYGGYKATLGSNSNNNKNRAGIQR